jgi:uncharacterized protein YndB with AHSA1/START domain
MTAAYNFVTRWHLDASIDRVWDAIFHCERWPTWWTGVESAALLDPGGDGRLGSLWRYTWKSALPYRLTFNMRITRLQAPVVLDGVADGELAGEGRWRLFRNEAGTLVKYEWDVQTTGAWMSALAPVVRPLFAWNHDVVMRRGGQGLARLLEEPADPGLLLD